MNHLRCKLSAPLSKAIFGLSFTAHQHAAPWGEPRPAVQKHILKLKPGSPCCFCVYSCRQWCRSSIVEEMVFSPNFTSLILIRGDELRVRAPTACLPSRERLTVGWRPFTYTPCSVISPPTDFWTFDFRMSRRLSASFKITIC